MKRETSSNETQQASQAATVNDGTQGRDSSTVNIDGGTSPNSPAHGVSAAGERAGAGLGTAAGGGTDASDRVKAAAEARYQAGRDYADTMLGKEPQHEQRRKTPRPGEDMPFPKDDAPQDVHMLDVADALIEGMAARYSSGGGASLAELRSLQNSLKTLRPALKCPECGAKVPRDSRKHQA